ncbi:hypothetical protein [Alteromonas sp. 14N.309.X.WAT.G.H12]|uniref:hypothetical protein n=1 Tax=Alteromonas sp. 14N.309.X.WAT.G.H12 TaxID=3120824 RepID=UPI002FD77A45
MKLNLKNLPLLSVAAVITLALSGCSEESDDTATTTADDAPTLSINDYSSSVDEGDVITIGYNADDDNEADPTITIASSDLQGDVVVGSHLIQYTAPWLDEDDSITETFTIVATDSSGQTTKEEVSLTVSDIDDPVSLTVSPPSQARGFENTQTDTLLNFWIDEGQEAVTISYELKEADADLLLVSYSLSDESFIFENNIAATQETVGDTTTVKLSFALPEIVDTSSTVSESSEDVSLTLSVDDGDDIVSAVVNMTVVNVVDLGWASGNPSTISESDGGVLTYTSSESDSYSGEYIVDLFDEDGNEIDLDFDLDTEARTITFGENEGIIGDQVVEVVIQHVNVISNAAGEDYDATFSASKTITIIDDRDDSFLSLEEQYETNLTLFSDIRTRRDEDRVASAAASYLFLNGWVDESESESFKTQVSLLLDEETEELVDLADQIDDGLNGDGDTESTEALMEDFSDALYGFGATARKYMTEQMEAYEAMESNVDKDLGLGVLSQAGTAYLYDETYVTHYVGNPNYGHYEADDEWVFDSTYGYLAVADITDSYCF